MESSEEEFKDSPIGKLIEKGFSNQKISSITGISSSGVSKWRNGTNRATAYAQNRAQAYLDVWEQAEANQSATSVVVAETKAEEDHLFVVSVPVDKMEKFQKLMTMIGLTAVDMD